MEIVKLRMQMNVEDGIKRSTSETVKELGARGLYRAITACWLRDVPFSFIFFPLAANLKTAFNGDESLLGLFTASALAGSIAAGVVTPFDVIKTNRQKRGGDTAFRGTNPLPVRGHAGTRACHTRRLPPRARVPRGVQATWTACARCKPSSAGPRSRAAWCPV